MSAMRWWGPSADLVSAARTFDRVFDQLIGQGAAPSEDGMPSYTLPVDILESDDAYLLYATVAGIPAENVDVTFEDGLLSIVATAPPFERQGRWLRQERAWGSWTRRLELPKEVEAKGITAQFENGVLMVRVPKAQKAQPVRIPVGATTQASQG